MQYFVPPQETKVKAASQTKVEEYPEIENFIPYDPLGNYNTFTQFNRFPSGATTEGHIYRFYSNIRQSL